MKLHSGLVTGVIGFVLGSLLSTQAIRGQGQTLTNLEGTFSHVAVVVRDAEKSAKTFHDVFGVDVPPVRTLRHIPFPPSYGNKTMAVKTTSFPVNGMRIELVQPFETGSPWKDHLDKYGESVHHIAFTVPEYAAAVKYLQSKGGKWVQGNTDVNFGYIDMMPQLGFTIETVGAGGAHLPPQ